MSYYYRCCPACRAYLDPGEVCECTKKAAVSAANADGGEVENGLNCQLSTSMIPEISENASGKTIDERREELIQRVMTLTDEQCAEVMRLWKIEMERVHEQG